MAIAPFYSSDNHINELLRQAYLVGQLGTHVSISRASPSQRLVMSTHLGTYLRISTYLLQPQVDVVHWQKLIMLPTLRHSTLKRVTVVQQDEWLRL